MAKQDVGSNPPLNFSENLDDLKDVPVASLPLMIHPTLEF
jgi:hypothetical protein